MIFKIRQCAFRLAPFDLATIKHKEVENPFWANLHSKTQTGDNANVHRKSCVDS